MAQHPITPSDELIGEWIDTDEGGPNVISRIATCAAQWGADQELEACCEWFQSNGYHEFLPDKLRAARRPKPPSLKGQALEALAHILNNSSTQLGADTIRRALEQLPDHE
jgi:hypothetical protein